MHSNNFKAYFDFPHPSQAKSKRYLSELNSYESKLVENINEKYFGEKDSRKWYHCQKCQWYLILEGEKN